VPGAPDQVRDDEVPIPCLHATSPPRPSARAAAASPAGSDDEAPILHFSHFPALVSCYDDAEVPVLSTSVSVLSSSTSLLLFALNLPRRLADALWVWSILICFFLFLFLPIWEAWPTEASVLKVTPAAYSIRKIFVLSLIALG
jgi:hypothetical protein